MLRTTADKKNKYSIRRFKYDNEEALIETSGKFKPRSFYDKSGRMSSSITLALDESQEGFWFSLDEKIRKLINYSIIQENDSEDRFVPFKVHSKQSESMDVKFSRRVGRVIEPVDPESMSDSTSWDSVSLFLRISSRGQSRQ